MKTPLQGTWDIQTQSMNTLNKEEAWPAPIICQPRPWCPQWALEHPCYPQRLPKLTVGMKRLLMPSLSLSLACKVTVEVPYWAVGDQLVLGSLACPALPQVVSIQDTSALVPAADLIIVAHYCRVQVSSTLYTVASTN